MSKSNSGFYHCPTEDPDQKIKAERMTGGFIITEKRDEPFLRRSDLSDPQKCEAFKECQG